MDTHVLQYEFCGTKSAPKAFYLKSTPELLEVLEELAKSANDHNENIQNIDSLNSKHSNLTLCMNQDPYLKISNAQYSLKVLENEDECSDKYTCYMCDPCDSRFHQVGFIKQKIQVEQVVNEQTKEKIKRGQEKLEKLSKSRTSIVLQNHLKPGRIESRDVLDFRATNKPTQSIYWTPSIKGLSLTELDKLMQTIEPSIADCPTSITPPISDIESSQKNVNTLSSVLKNGSQAVRTASRSSARSVEKSTRNASAISRVKKNKALLRTETIRKNSKRAKVNSDADEASAKPKSTNISLKNTIPTNKISSSFLGFVDPETGQELPYELEIPQNIQQILNSKNLSALEELPSICNQESWDRCVSEFQQKYSIYSQILQILKANNELFEKLSTHLEKAVGIEERRKPIENVIRTLYSKRLESIDRLTQYVNVLHEELKQLKGHIRANACASLL